LIKMMLTYYGGFGCAYVVTHFARRRFFSAL